MNGFSSFITKLCSILASAPHHIYSTYLPKLFIGSSNIILLHAFAIISTIFFKYFILILHHTTSKQALDWALALGSQLGLHFQPAKIAGSSTTLEIELDSIAVEARLPHDKFVYLCDILSKWSAKKFCTLRKLQEITGHLQFASQVIPISRAFMRALFDFSSTFSTSRSRRRIPLAVRRDINWWSSFSHDWNGVHFISLSCGIIHIYTDASVLVTSLEISSFLLVSPVITASATFNLRNFWPSSERSCALGSIKA